MEKPLKVSEQKALMMTSGSKGGKKKKEYSGDIHGGLEENIAAEWKWWLLKMCVCENT